MIMSGSDLAWFSSVSSRQLCVWSSWFYLC